MMHHAQIAQRAFNTPLMVDPAKALAFLSGLGPRITGQEITFQGLEVETDDQTAASLPARASLFGNDLAQRHQRNGTQPFAVVDGLLPYHPPTGLCRVIGHRADYPWPQPFALGPKPPAPMDPWSGLDLLRQ